MVKGSVLAIVIKKDKKTWKESILLSTKAAQEQRIT